MFLNDLLNLISAEMCKQCVPMCFVSQLTNYAEQSLPRSDIQLFRSFLHLTETKVSWPCSQQPVTGSYPKHVHPVHPFSPHTITFECISMLSSHLSLGFPSPFFLTDNIANHKNNSYVLQECAPEQYIEIHCINET